MTIAVDRDVKNRTKQTKKKKKKNIGLCDEGDLDMTEKLLIGMLSIKTNNSADDNKSMKNYPACKESKQESRQRSGIDTIKHHT